MNYSASNYITASVKDGIIYAIDPYRGEQEIGITNWNAAELGGLLNVAALP
ncbi:MAG: hypothetical protein FWD67_08145 [Betaproteobacteria bacterium]|nr:hypothetical protein [Betaproteobacteria bacterium]